MAGEADIDEVERGEEMDEERKAADGKPRKMSVEVAALPKVRRGSGGEVVSVEVPAKARFKGDVVLRLRGDIASAFWSVTPGMKLSVLAVERDDREYDVVSLDLITA